MSMRASRRPCSATRAIASEAWRIEMVTPRTILEIVQGAARRRGRDRAAPRRPDPDGPDGRVAGPPGPVRPQPGAGARQLRDDEPARGLQRQDRLDAGLSCGWSARATTASRRSTPAAPMRACNSPRRRRAWSMQPLSQALQEYPEQAGPYADIHALVRGAGAGADGADVGPRRFRAAGRSRRRGAVSMRISCAHDRRHAEAATEAARPRGRPRSASSPPSARCWRATASARVGVNAIAREAGVDKVLIYRYFGGLPELLRQWGASGRFWPSVDELLGDDAERDARAAGGRALRAVLRPLHRRAARAAADDRDPGRRDRHAQRADRHPRDRARAVGRGGRRGHRGPFVSAPAGTARRHAAAGGRGAVPAGALTHDPHLRRAGPEAATPAGRRSSSRCARWPPRCWPMRRQRRRLRRRSAPRLRRGTRASCGSRGAPGTAGTARRCIPADG